MRIISNDSYFSWGLNCIIKQMPGVNTDDLIIFDAGQLFVYIFHATELQKHAILDPHRALFHCCRFYIMRNSSISEYAQALSSVWPNQPLQQRLTHREEWVIKALCSEPDAEELRERLSINRKTFSAHKIKGLRKLGVGNVVMLYSLLLAWKEHWPDIRPELQIKGDDFPSQGEAGSMIYRFPDM